MSTVAALLLVIRVFDRSGQSATDRSAAVRTADSILRQADIATTWVDCSRDSPTATRRACTAPLAPNELSLRVTPAPSKDRLGRQRPLGYSLVEPNGDGGVLGTVFSDRVAWLADRARSRRSTLLGRTMAHEVGHLLIGTNEHSSAGLMRPVWTTDDLTRNRDEDWQFTAEDQRRFHNSRVGDHATRVADATAGHDES